ncbi:MAG TPA: MmgE/PrpD family protein, partial [Isosphaeraceae bacterium]|nr:MmgE/PrpD family protein [Isosphaeraceae bacterium]
MTTSLADRLATFALQTRFEDLPAEVVLEAKRRLLDTLGCAVGAMDESAPLIARRAAAQVAAQS